MNEKDLNFLSGTIQEFVPLDSIETHFGANFGLIPWVCRIFKFLNLQHKLFYEES